MMNWLVSTSLRLRVLVLALSVVLMIVGMIEFSRLYNVQISLSNAAREGARVMAIYNNTGTASSAAVAAAIRAGRSRERDTVGVGKGWRRTSADARCLRVTIKCGEPPTAWCL